MVDGEDLAAVHLDEAAEWKLCVIDAQLLGRLKGDALQTKTHTRREGPPEEELRLHRVAASHRLYLVMVVVNKSSYHVGFAEVELFQLGGGVRGQVDQLLRCSNLTKVFGFQMNILQNQGNSHR